MGTYIYRLVPPSKALNVAMGDETVTLGGLIYAYKPWWGGYDPDKANAECERRYVDPTRRAWRGCTTPEYVTHGCDDKGKPEDGSYVYKWRKGRVSWADHQDPGKFIGVLRNRGAGWVIEPDTKLVGVDVVREEVIPAHGVFPEGRYTFQVPMDYDPEPNEQMLKLVDALDDPRCEYVSCAAVRYITHPKMEN